MIAYIKNCLILWYILLALYGEFYAADETDDAKCPLHHAQGTDVSCVPVEFSDDPFNDQYGNTKDPSFKKIVFFIIQ